MTKFAPKYVKKYVVHERIHTLRDETLCKYVPAASRAECKGRASGCLTLKDYPYSRKKLVSCFTQKPKSESETDPDSIEAQTAEMNRKADE